MKRRKARAQLEAYAATRAAQDRIDDARDAWLADLEARRLASRLDAQDHLNDVGLPRQAAPSLEGISA